MRKILSFLIISLFAFGLVVNEASAKRFGGGRSFGVQRSSSSYSSFNKSSMNSMGQRSNASRWGGMLGGLLIGGLLASLFMQNGIAGGILTWLIVGAVILFLISVFRRRMQPGFQGGPGNRFSQNPLSDFQNQFTNNRHSAANRDSVVTYPVGFNADNFLREAKVLFMRLQAAYDQQNHDDLREFTSPEVMAEIQMQFQERGDEANQTEVLKLDVQLLDLSRDANEASVRFTGLIKENNNSPESFNEIWHFRQFNNAWIVTGVQQQV